MIVVMKRSATKQQLQKMVSHVESLGLKPTTATTVRSVPRMMVGFSPNDST